MLTDAQKLILKADIEADPILNAQPLTPEGASNIGAAYDLMSAPEFFVWRSSVDVQQIMENGYLWTYVDNMTVGKARIWEWLTQYGSFDPSKANVQAAISECYKGTALALQAGDVVLGHCRRQATRGEKLFSDGAGTTASPATMSFEGSLQLLWEDIIYARIM